MRVRPCTTSCDDAIRAKNVPHNGLCPVLPWHAGNIPRWSIATRRVAPIAADEDPALEAAIHHPRQRDARPVVERTPLEPSSAACGFQASAASSSTISAGSVCKKPSAVSMRSVWFESALPRRTRWPCFLHAPQSRVRTIERVGQYPSAGDAGVERAGSPRGSARAKFRGPALNRPHSCIQRNRQRTLQAA